MVAKPRKYHLMGYLCQSAEYQAKDLIDGLKVDESGYVIATENCETNISGIFVAGDVRKKDLRQLVTATSDGAIAATAALNYLAE